MNYLKTFFFLFSTIINTYSLLGEIIIRQATRDDLPVIYHLINKEAQEHYKPLFGNIPAEKLETFIAEKIKFLKKEALLSLTQENRQQCGLLIAYDDIHNQLAGYCQFHVNDNAILHITLLGVDKPFQRQGIGKKLLLDAMNTFKNIEQCQLTTPIENITAHLFYEKMGFVKKGLVTVNHATREINQNQLEPTDILYCYTIK